MPSGAGAIFSPAAWIEGGSPPHSPLRPAGRPRGGGGTSIPCGSADRPEQRQGPDQEQGGRDEDGGTFAVPEEKGVGKREHDASRIDGGHRKERSRIVTERGRLTASTGVPRRLSLPGDRWRPGPGRIAAGGPASRLVPRSVPSLRRTCRAGSRRCGCTASGSAASRYSRCPRARGCSGRSSPRGAAA
jgi:hypothetical protein